VTGSLFLLIGAAPAVAAPCGAIADCPTSASYSGSWKATSVAEEVGGANIYTVELEWAETFDGRYWTLESVQGKLSESDGEKCEAGLRLAASGAQVFQEAQEDGPGYAPFFLPAEAGGEPDLDPTGEPGVVFVAEAPLMIRTAPEESSSVLESTDKEERSFCNGNVIESVSSGNNYEPEKWAYLFNGQPGCHWYTNAAGVYGDATFFPAPGTWTASDNCSGKFEPYEGEPYEATLTQSITVSLPGAPSPLAKGPSIGPSPPSPPARPGSAKRQQQAREEGRKLLAEAKVKCTAGLGETAVATLLAPETYGAALLEPLVTAPSKAETAGECVKLIEQALHQAQIYKNDPPDADTGQVTLPVAVAGSPSAPCPSAARTASLCRAVTPLRDRAQAAARRVASIEQALTSTSNRLGTAAAAGDQADAALQEATFDALDGELVPALKAQNAADAALAAKLTRKHVKLVFKQGAVSKAIASILAHAGAHGVSREELEAVSEGELLAGAFDYSTSLLPVSTLAPSELAHSISLAGLSAIYAALNAQGLIPAGSRHALEAELNGAAATTSAAVEGAKLRAFLATAGKIRGEAGRLLGYAAKPLGAPTATARALRSPAHGRRGHSGPTE
jgi:hypothetical protein